jgi:hypothetical protein
LTAIKRPATVCKPKEDRMTMGVYDGRDHDPEPEIVEVEIPYELRGPYREVVEYRKDGEKPCRCRWRAALTVASVLVVLAYYYWWLS